MQAAQIKDFSIAEGFDCQSAWGGLEQKAGQLIQKYGEGYMAERALPDEDPLKTNQVPNSVVGVSCFCFAQVMRSLIDLFGFHRISLVPSFHAWVFLGPFWCGRITDPSPVEYAVSICAHAQGVFPDGGCSEHIWGQKRIGKDLSSKGMSHGFASFYWIEPLNHITFLDWVHEAWAGLNRIANTTVGCCADRSVAKSPTKDYCKAAGGTSDRRWPRFGFAKHNWLTF